MFWNILLTRPGSYAMISLKYAERTVKNTERQNALDAGGQIS